MDPIFLYRSAKHNLPQYLFHIYCQICDRNKYAHQIGHICQIFDGLTRKMYIQIFATYDVTAINHVT